MPSQDSADELTTLAHLLMAHSDAFKKIMTPREPSPVTPPPYHYVTSQGFQQSHAAPEAGAYRLVQSDPEADQALQAGEAPLHWPYEWPPQNFDWSVLNNLQFDQYEGSRPAFKRKRTGELGHAEGGAAMPSLDDFLSP